MKELVGISNKILRNLNKKENVREKTLAQTRVITKSSKEIISRIHNRKDVDSNFKKIREDVRRLNDLLKAHPDLRASGFSVNAYQEYAEAVIFHAIMFRKPVPDPSDLDIDDIPYALGLGDVVGELRRVVLNRIIDNDLDSAKYHFRNMEMINDILIKFNYPDGLIPIRRKQDVSRGIIEKTQGELAVALTTDSLQNKFKNTEQKRKK